MSKGAKLPSDATALAVLVQDPKTPRELRDVAICQLHLIIQRLAQGVAYSLTVPLQMSYDLIDEATSYVWERLRSFNGKDGGKFSPWCRRVLRNWCIDRVRELRRAPVHSETDLGLEEPDGLCTPDSWTDRPTADTLDVLLDRKQPFGPDDLERIRSWKLRERLVLLALTNLWIKVPREEWSEWVQEYGLPEPYPPASCVVAGDQTERVRVLAECCGMLPNTLSQLWCRKKLLLAELDYIRGLQGAA